MNEIRFSYFYRSSFSRFAFIFHRDQKVTKDVRNSFLLSERFEWRKKSDFLLGNSSLSPEGYHYAPLRAFTKSNWRDYER